MGLRDTLIFQNYKVAINPMYRYLKLCQKMRINKLMMAPLKAAMTSWAPFLTIINYCYCYSTKFDNIQIYHRPFLKYKLLSLAYFSRSYCCYGNQLCNENDNNVVTNDWVVF